MASNVIDSILDEDKIQKQLDKLNNDLLKTTGNLSTCAVQAKNFSDQFANAKGINDIIKLMEEYNKVIVNAQKQQNDAVNIEKKRADTQVQLQKVQESNAKAELLNAQAALVNAKAQAEVDKATKTRIDSETRAAAQASKSEKAELDLLNAKQALINILSKEGVSVDKMNMTKSQALAINKLVITANNAEKGSREQLAAEYELNYKAFSKLSTAQQDTSSGKAFQKSVEEQGKTVKGLEGSLGNFTRDVGNYKENILSALGANQGFLGNMANMAMGAEKAGTSFGVAGANGVKAFGTAMLELLANPVVAIIAAIAAVFMLMKAAIDSNGEATNKLNQIMAPFKEILVIVLQAFSELVTVVLNGVLELEKFANVVLSVIPGLDKLAEKNLQSIELEKQSQELKEKSRQLLVDEARTHEQTTEAMNKSRQKDKYSVEQRLTWMKAADNAEITLNEQKVEHAKQTFELIKKEMENEGKSYSDLTSDKKEAYMKAEADIYSAREEYFAKTRRLQSQESNLLLESQKDYIDNMTKKGNAEIESWKTSQNTSNMNSKQKIAYEQEYANKVINLQKDMNAQRIADQIKNDADGLEKTKEAIDKKIRIQNEAWINEAGITKDEYNRRKELTLKTIADHQKAEEDKSKEGTNKKVKAIEDENSVLESQRVQDHQKAISEYESYQISLLQKQHDAHISMEKAEANYDNMTYEQKLVLDGKLFFEDQNHRVRIANLRKMTDEERTAELDKIYADTLEFQNKQLQSVIQHEEQMIGIDKSFIESQVKVDQDYGNKSLAYQQHITRELFEIQASADENLARLKYQNNSITITELNTTLNNIKAQRAALLESQKIALESDFKSTVSNLDVEKMNESLSEMHKLYEEGKISAQKYEKSIKSIKEKGAEDQLTNQIWLDKQQLEDLKKKGEDTTKLQQEITSKEESLDAKKAAVKLQKEKAVQKAIVELIKTTASAIQTIGDDQFQAQLDRIDKLKTANSDAATDETNVVAKKLASGVLNQKEADAQDAAITAQKELRDKQLDEQATQIKIKQAKFDKEMSAFNIFINTASAVTEALPNIPLSIIIGAMGAIELAAVLARPLPQYATGTEDHPGGMAVVGDAFKHELGLTPEGKIIKTPNVPTVMDLPIHTKVFPDFDMAFQELAINASLSSMSNSMPSIEINAYNDSELSKHLSSLSVDTKNQTTELSSRLRTLDISLSGIDRNTRALDKTMKNLKKSPWVS